MKLNKEAAEKHRQKILNELHLAQTQSGKVTTQLPVIQGYHHF